MFERKKPSGKLLSLPIDQIHPSPFQARKSFDEQELTALAQSIRENGLLQPVTVRKAAEGYELVAGERRLRACQLAKMTTIPAILCSYADDRTAALGLLENIQRADLNPFEQAQGLRDVMVLWDCTQAEAAKRLGMAQPTFANKLRLLQLTADQRQFVLDNNLTERHARAVLRLPENRRSEALITIAKRRLNARQTDSYIEQLLNSPPKPGHRISMVRDVRIFVNTIDHAIRLMTDNGVPATAHREEKDGYIEYTVRIPTAAAEKRIVPCGTGAGASGVPSTSVLALSVTCGASSPKGRASGETGDFAIYPITFPPCQGPHLRGGCLRSRLGEFRQLPFGRGSPLAKPHTLHLSCKLSRHAKGSPFGRAGA